MDEGYRLRWQHVILADAIAIAVCLILIWQYVGFGGTGIMAAIVSPVMAVICSVGVLMWANGIGSNFTNGPKWDTMNEEQKGYASSAMGFHLALGMTVVACGVPMIMISFPLGLIAFMLMMFCGVGIVMWGVFRVFNGTRVAGRKFVPKSATTVWGFYILLLFAIVSVPILVSEASPGAGGITVELTEDSVSVDAPMADFSIDYSDIDTVELVDDFERGSRKSGYSDTRISSGTYNNQSLGTYKLAAYDACGSCIVIRTVSGSAFAFNQSDVSDTEKLYGDILSRIS